MRSEDVMKAGDKAAVVGGSLGAVGGALVAIFGTLCCAGPVVVAVLGVGGAVAAAKMEPYRPYFITASVALVAFGFWRLRRAKRCACLSPREARWLPVMLWFATALTVLTAILPIVLRRFE
jgi:mercuric ion transport protein